MKYYHNGEYLSGQDVRGIKGETWPIVSVAGGATLQVCSAALAVPHHREHCSARGTAAFAARFGCGMCGHGYLA